MYQLTNEQQWREAIEQFRLKEKAHTRAQDQLAAERRRLPMMEITKEYQLQGCSGPVSLIDLFEGHEQLIVYHFMFKDSPCTGCSMIVDNMGHPAHLELRNTKRVLVSLAPIAELETYRAKMGWDIPWYSSAGSDFNQDFDALRDGADQFAVSVFLRDGERVFRSYFTHSRGVEQLGSNFSYLDLTPMGRRETWEEAPAHVEQTPPYVWWKKREATN